MKLKRFVQLLQQNNIVIDTSEKGLIFAHYIYRRYPVLSEENIRYVVQILDKEGYFLDVYSRIRNLSFDKKSNRELWNKQNEILMRPFAHALEITQKKKVWSLPYHGISEVDRKAVLRNTTKHSNRHRYVLDRFRSPTMSIGSNGLVSVDSRYAKLREDYDDK